MVRFHLLALLTALATVAAAVMVTAAPPGVATPKAVDAVSRGSSRHCRPSLDARVRAVVKEHLDALNECDVPRLMAQHPYVRGLGSQPVDVPASSTEEWVEVVGQPGELLLTHDYGAMPAICVYVVYLFLVLLGMMTLTPAPQARLSVPRHQRLHGGPRGHARGVHRSVRAGRQRGPRRPVPL